jgi:DNA-binding PadR family transcriptional regulator
LAPGRSRAARDISHGPLPRFGAGQPIRTELVISPSQPSRPLRPHKELLTAWLLLLLERYPSYGYELRRELAANGLVIDSSALYRALRQLERDGWVESQWTLSEAGPRRRLYRLTPSGRENLNAIAALIRDIRDVNDSFVRAHETVTRKRRRGSGR